MIYSEKYKQFVLEHENDNIEQLALRAASFPDIDMPFVLRQIAGRKIAKSKIPSWYLQQGIIYPKHISLEQCSSESTARYKAQLIKGNSLLDMTGGLGVDFSFMAMNTQYADYVEQQETLTEIARYNFNVLGLQHCVIIQSNAIDYLKSTDKTFGTIYIDPARRTEKGQKASLIEDCVPNVLDIYDLMSQKAVRIIIKLSPMLDITQALTSLKDITQVHVVSVGNECKELLLVKDKSEPAVPPRIICTNILKDKTSSFSFTHREEAETAIDYTYEIGHYLYEPNSSAMKAGCYKSLAKAFGLYKLHPNSHLYTSDMYEEGFPGRIFMVQKVIHPNKAELKQHLKEMDKANITVRNYPVPVAEIRKQTKLKDGGEHYLFATTLFNEKKVFILCTRANPVIASDCFNR